jgi:hypothetical protein
MLKKSVVCRYTIPFYFILYTDFLIQYDLDMLVSSHTFPPLYYILAEGKCPVPVPQFTPLYNSIRLLSMVIEVIFKVCLRIFLFLASQTIIVFGNNKHVSGNTNKSEQNCKSTALHTYVSICLLSSYQSIFFVNAAFVICF